MKLKSVVNSELRYSYAQLRISDSSPAASTWPEWQGALDPEEEYVFSDDTILLRVGADKPTISVTVVYSLDNFDLEGKELVTTRTLILPSKKIDIGDVIDFGGFVLEIDNREITISIYAVRESTKRENIVLLLQ